MTGEAKTLLLHIGANKTGSSAIQEFLRLNADGLAQRGLRVAPGNLLPRGVVTGQHVPVLKQLRQDIGLGRKTVAERIRGLMEEARPGARLVISAENLSNLDGIHELFADAAAEHQTHVVLYIRRQDDLLLSSWQQWGSKISNDFWAWMIAAAGVRGDWRATLERWEGLVPRERIAVRIYDRARLYRGDVVADFLQLLGLEQQTDSLRMPETISNPSYCEAVVDLLKGDPQLFRDAHDNRAFDMIGELTGERFYRSRRESPVTHEQRIALLQKYRASNNWVKNRYFHDVPGPLFPNPEAGDYDLIKSESLIEKKWELVASLIFALYQKLPR